MQKWDCVNSNIKCAGISDKNLVARIRTLASLQCSMAGESSASQAQVLERKGAPHSTWIPSDHGEMVRSLQRRWNWGFTKWWNKAQGGYLRRGWLVKWCWVCNSNRVKGIEENKTNSYSGVLFKELYKLSPSVSCWLIRNFKGLP